MLELNCGDKVEHKKFGAGLVVDIEGNKITVKFNVGEKRVLDVFLRKVGSADGKGIRYWQKEWDKLINEWLLARRQVDKKISALMGSRPSDRPTPDALVEIKLIEDREQLLRKKLETFIHDDISGNHV